MAVELNRSQVAYKPIRSSVYQPQRPNLRLVLNNQLQANASKAAFNASMEKASLSQKYWNELLEKLRKAGGGGGGNDNRFDRIAVSMMLSNFLNSKTIQAMLRNFSSEMFGLNNIPNQINNSSQIQIGNIMQTIGKSILTGMTNLLSLMVPRDATTGRLHPTLNQLSTLISLLSFQLNKLKELLENDLKETIKKLDVKEKLKKVKTFVLDFFVEMKDTLLSVVEFVKLNLFFKLDF